MATHRIKAAVVAVAAGAMLLAGCGGGTNAAGSGENDPDATLRIMYGMAASLDPVDAPEPAQLTFSTWPVYDTLITIGDDSTYQPMLATEWKFSADGKALSLTLRDGVTFSDGTPFDAAAVKANLDRYLAADKSAVQIALGSVASVETTGKLTVDVKLKQPTTAILSALASNLGGIMISPKALTSGDLKSKPVGTGAYTIESFKPGEEAVYVRRTDAGAKWDPKTGNVAKVVIKKIASDDAKYNALKSGQIDVTTWTGDPTVFTKGQVQTVALDTALNLVGMYFNPKVKPLDDVKVRQAINMAIDRKGITEAFGPENEVRVQPWPKGLGGFENSREEQYTFDPKAAKDLLAEAGYPDGFTIPGEFLTNNASSIDKISEVVQANLSDIGIKFELRPMDILSQITGYAEGNYSGQFMYMSLPSIDSSAWLQRLFANPVWSPAGPSPEMTALMAGAEDPTLSDDERAAKVSKAVQYATDNALYAPIFQGVGGLAASNKVTGLDVLPSQSGVANLRYLGMTK
ncbi:ABC transporter substrate-binding protein [Nocardioides sp. Root140]|uniref:ABC transporter substrate-binding protein n=1 Tax=Nocardioides sp. Root140 TaxID=1736460 RepID=UPI00138F5686|nr:ABC transporter substrate-binding protein [Nocardioides sp. Root140]